MKVTITINHGRPTEINEETLERILFIAEVILDRLRNIEKDFPTSDYIALDMISKLKYKLSKG